MQPAPGDILLNEGRESIRVEVANAGDRPIQVGSHYHFFETNPALKFDRLPTRGMRLNIPAGTAVRFEPGQSREVELVALRRAAGGVRLPGRGDGTARQVTTQAPCPAGERQKASKKTSQATKVQATKKGGRR